MLSDEVLKEIISLFFMSMETNRGSPQGFEQGKVDKIKEGSKLLLLKNQYAPRLSIDFEYVETKKLVKEGNNITITNGELRRGNYYNRDCRLRPPSMTRFEARQVTNTDIQQGKVYVIREISGF